MFWNGNYRPCSVWRDPKSERYRFRDFFSVPKFSETGSETFFGTKKIRDRFRDIFRYQIFFETDSDTIKKKPKIPGTGRDRDQDNKIQVWFWDFSVLNFFCPRFRDFSVPNFFETNSETFFGTKIFRDRFRDFFRYQIFSIPIPRLFSVPNIFETGSGTFFGTKFFRYRFRYHQKNRKIPGNGNSRYWDVTLCFQVSWRIWLPTTPLV